MLYAYFGHPKSASTWLSGLFLGVCNDLGLKSYYGQLALKKNTIESIQDSKADFLISQNSSYDKAQQLPLFKGIHVIRDPRDMCVSAYFSFLKTHAIDDWKE